MLLMAMLLAGKTRPAPININTATAAELKTLPGVGDTMASAILHYRERNGAFRRIEDLLIIKNVSKRRLNTWRPYLRLK